MKIHKIILFCLCIAFLLAGSLVTMPDFGHLRIMGGVGCLLLVYSVWLWLKNGNGLIGPFLIFLIALYLFSFGQSLMYPFNIVSERDLEGFQGITTKDIFDAQIYTLFYLAAFQIGALSAGATYERKNLSGPKPNNRRILRIGWFLFAISVVPYYKGLIANLVLSMARGYGALYEQDAKIGIDNLGAFVADLFIPSLICLFVAYRDRKAGRLFIEFLCVFNIVAILFTGGRTNAVILVALLLILHNSIVKPFSKKALTLIGVGLIFFLSFLSYISETRTEWHRTLSGGDVEVSQNSVVNVVGEMGASMFCLVKTQDIVPDDENFRFGKSYFYSFTTLIPNLGFWETHPAKKEANLSNWLTDKLQLSYGTGFSMCAEAYANFGVFGFLIFLLFGYFFSYFFGGIEKVSKTGDSPFLIFLLIIFWFALKLPRNPFITFVRPFFFYAVPIYWACRGYIFTRTRRSYRTYRS